MTSTESTDVLHISVLGAPLVTLAGMEVSGFKSAKTLALLVYLAVNQESQRRATLAALLWPDSNEQKAHTSLRSALSTLRKLLPDDILADRHTIALRRDRLWLDAEQFTMLLRRTGDPTADFRQRQTAISLYRGEFLAGFHVSGTSSFEAWVNLVREQLNQAASAVLLELARGHVAHEDYEASLAMLAQLLTLQPGNEAAHRLKLSTLAYMGQRATAILYYETYRSELAEDLGVDPEPETQALYQMLLAGNVTNGVVLKPSSDPDAGISTVVSPTAPLPMVDPGDMPGRTPFFGRTDRLEEGVTWLTDEQCSLIVVSGIGGVGKTTFASELVHRLSSLSVAEGGYRRIVWRTLLNAPPLEEILDSWIRALVQPPPEHLPESLDDKFALLFTELKSERCLLILDNGESIISNGGSYRHGYTDYRQLFERMAYGHHRSCLLMTTREQPKGLERLLRDYPRVRVTSLDGLSLRAGADLLAAYKVDGTGRALTLLVTRYSGNPLALKLIAATINNFYASELDAFLGDETVIFDDMRDVLDQHYDRLDSVAQELLIWLAVERESTDWETLWSDLVAPPARRVFIEAIRALRRSSLLTDVAQDEAISTRNTSDIGPVRPGYLTLQNVVMEYVADRLLHALFSEIAAGQLDHLHRFALRKAGAIEHVQDIQRRLLLEPLAQWLVQQYGRESAGSRLRELRTQARNHPTWAQGYVGANLLHLMRHLKIDMSCEDFSYLTFRQADFRRMSLHDADLRGAHFADVRFADSFGSVSSVAASPDGHYLAAGAGCSAIVWHRQSLQPHVILEGHTRDVAEVAFAPDGQRMASASYDGTIFLWNIRTGERMLQLSTHMGDLNSIAFRPVGDVLVSGGHNGHIEIFDWRRGERIGQLDLAQRIVRLAFAPTGELLAYVGYRGEIQGWDIDTRVQHFTLRGGEIVDLGFGALAVGNAYIVAGRGTSINIWEKHSRELAMVLRGHDALVVGLALSPDESLIATAGMGGTIAIRETRTGHPLRYLEGHQGTVRTMAFAPDGRQLVSGGYDETVRIWDIQTGLEQSRLQGRLGWVRTLVFSPDGRHLAGATLAGVIYLWRGHDLSELGALRRHKSAVRTLAFSPDSRVLATGGDDGCVMLWDVQSGEHLHTLNEHEGRVRTVAFDAHGRYLASGGNDHTIGVWDVKSGRLLKVLLNTSASTIKGVAFSPNDCLVAYGDTNGNLQLYHVETDSVIASVAVAGRPNAVVFSPSAPQIACGTYDGKVTVWDIVGQGPSMRLAERSQFHPTSQSVWQLLYSGDGSRLAWNGEIKDVCVASIADRMVSYRIPGNHLATCVAFTADGQKLLTDGLDQAVQLWDAATGASAQPLVGHTSNLTALSASPSSSRVASSDAGGVIKLWDIEPGVELATTRLNSPYNGMKIRGATGLTTGQQRALVALGAVVD